MGFKENLKMLRKAKGMTQKELGELIDKTFLTVSRYENGSIFPSHKTLKEICKIFDIELTNLVMNVTYENKKYTFEEVKKILEDKRSSLAKINLDSILKEIEEERNTHTQHNNLSEKEDNKENTFKEVYQQIYEYVSSHENKLLSNKFWKSQIDSLLSDEKKEILKFINDFLSLLKNDLIENNEIDNKEALQILNDLKKYYLFLTSENDKINHN